tara:strand:- start:2193 stop:2570 length:378 start_codon:yes stop_codon:yes gene_type:complete
MADSFLVSSEFAGELQETVIAVKSIVGDGGSGEKLAVDHAEGISVPKSSSQYVGSFSGAWAKGGTKSVTVLKYESGSWVSTSETVTAQNLFTAGIETGGRCFIAQESSTSEWILVAAECEDDSSS